MWDPDARFGSTRQRHTPGRAEEIAERLLMHCAIKPPFACSPGKSHLIRKIIHELNYLGVGPSCGYLQQDAFASGLDLLADAGEIIRGSQSSNAEQTRTRVRVKST